MVSYFVSRIGNVCHGWTHRLIAFLNIENRAQLFVFRVFGKKKELLLKAMT